MVSATIINDTDKEKYVDKVMSIGYNSRKSY